MPGAGSFTAANFLYARAPRDGTALGIVSQTVAIEEALGTSGVQYKVSQFNWIGRATSVNEVSLTFQTSNIKTIGDATANVTTMASTGAGSPSETYLKLLNAVAATKFKLVGPYPASNDAMLAMERGEVDGAFTSYNTLKVSRQDWLREKKINILVQYGERSTDLPDVPFAVDLAKTEEDRRLMDFYVGSEQIGRAFLAPPEIPADRVAALRKAYDETMQDPQLLAEIDAIAFGIQPAVRRQAAAAGGGNRGCAAHACCAHPQHYRYRPMKWPGILRNKSDPYAAQADALALTCTRLRTHKT